MSASVGALLLLCVAAPALLAACRSSEPAPTTSASSSATHLPAPPASFRYKSPYELTDPPGWDPHKDPELTLDRCRMTVWSYAGCQELFPKEGRAYLEEVCASGREGPMCCIRLAEYEIGGVGGPKDEAKGVATASKYCDDDNKIACAMMAKHLAASDREKARAYFYRACSDGRGPVGKCQEIDRVLAAGK